jgi:glycosyltransferase involved in cell wall biosynthesis
MTGFVYNRDAVHIESPTISVICINKNHAQYLEETIFSILSQRFEDFEFIIADGGSTDASIALIKNYRFIKLLSGSDSSRADGLLRAVSAARGRYVMITTSTDGYICRDWFRSASSLLDGDPQISLVFGASASMNNQGQLGQIAFPKLFPFDRAPSKESWPGIWLHGGFEASYLPELNYCARIDVLKTLIGPSVEFPELNAIDPILRFHFEFYRHGYLPQYLPILANFGREHPNQEQHSARNRISVEKYNSAWERYSKTVFSRQCRHFLRNGFGQPYAYLEV